MTTASGQTIPVTIGSMILLAYFALKPRSLNVFSFAVQAIALVLLALFLMTFFGPAWPFFLAGLLAPGLSQVFTQFENATPLP